MNILQFIACMVWLYTVSIRRVKSQRSFASKRRFFAPIPHSRQHQRHPPPPDRGRLHHSHHVSTTSSSQSSSSSSATTNNQRKHPQSCLVERSEKSNLEIGISKKREEPTTSNQSPSNYYFHEARTDFHVHPPLEQSTLSVSKRIPFDSVYLVHLPTSTSAYTHTHTHTLTNTGCTLVVRNTNTKTKKEPRQQTIPGNSNIYL